MRFVGLFLILLLIPGFRLDAKIVRVVTGGPYAYAIHRGPTGQVAVCGLANVNVALNAVRDDIVALIGPETPREAGYHVATEANKEFTVNIATVVTGGPWFFTVYERGAGRTVVGGLASLNAAFNASRDSLTSALTGQTVRQIDLQLTTLEVAP